MPSVKARGRNDAVPARGAPSETTRDAEGTTFVKARRVRSFDDVVDQVRAAIIDGSILAGERLPSERELAEQFGVSRATLREALRALEAVGLIEIRVGAHGGAFATEGGTERAVEPLSQVYDVEVATRPTQARRFRASLHADSVTWFDASSATLAAAADAVPRGSIAFLVALAEGSGMPLRAALAAAVESEGAGRKDPSLSLAERERVVALLREGRRDEGRDLVLRSLGGRAPKKVRR